MAHSTPTDSSVPGPADACSTSRTLALQLRTPEGPGRVWTLSETKTTLGSRSDCTIALPGAGVEPVHCLVIRGPKATVVRSWAPGTRLNGKQIVAAPLTLGDCLTLGTLELDVIDAEQDVKAAGSGATPASQPESDLDSGSLDPSSDLDQRLQRLEQTLVELRDGSPRDEFEHLRHRLETVSQQRDHSVRRQQLLVDEFTEAERGWREQSARDQRRLGKAEDSLRELTERLEACERLVSNSDDRVQAQQQCYSELVERLDQQEVRQRELHAELHDQLRAELDGVLERVASSEQLQARTESVDEPEQLAQLRSATESLQQLVEDLRSRVDDIDGRLDSPGPQQNGFEEPTLDPSEVAEPEAPEEASELDERPLAIEEPTTLEAEAEPPIENRIGEGEPPTTTARSTPTAMDDFERAVLEAGFAEPESRERSVPVAHDSPQPPASDVTRSHESEFPTEESEAGESEAGESEAGDSEAGDSEAGDSVDSNTKTLDQQEAPVSVAAELARLGKADLLLDNANDSDPPTAPGAMSGAPEPAALMQPPAALMQPPAGLAPPPNRQVGYESSLTLRGAYRPTNESQSADEDSIEQYMADLLQRMRGESKCDSVKPKPGPVMEPVFKADSNETRLAETEPDPSQGEDRVEESGESSESSSGPQKLVARSRAPELNSNLAAMRQLANDTARQAIDTHTKRSWKESAHSRAIASATAAVLAGGAAGYAWLGAQPMAYLPAAGALGISIFWSFQAIKIRRELSHYVRNRAAAANAPTPLPAADALEAEHSEARAADPAPTDL